MRSKLATSRLALHFSSSARHQPAESLAKSMQTTPKVQPASDRVNTPSSMHLIPANLPQPGRAWKLPALPSRFSADMAAALPALPSGLAPDISVPAMALPISIPSDTGPSSTSLPPGMTSDASIPALKTPWVPSDKVTLTALHPRMPAETTPLHAVHRAGASQHHMQLPGESPHTDRDQAVPASQTDAPKHTEHPPGPQREGMSAASPAHGTSASMHGLQHPRGLHNALSQPSDMTTGLQSRTSPGNQRAKLNGETGTARHRPAQKTMPATVSQPGCMLDTPRMEAPCEDPADLSNLQLRAATAIGRYVDIKAVQTEQEPAEMSTTAPVQCLGKETLDMQMPGRLLRTADSSARCSHDAHRGLSTHQGLGMPCAKFQPGGIEPGTGHQAAIPSSVHAGSQAHAAVPPIAQTECLDQRARVAQATGLSTMPAQGSLLRHGARVDQRNPSSSKIQSGQIQTSSGSTGTARPVSKLVVEPNLHKQSTGRALSSSNDPQKHGAKAQVLPLLTGKPTEKPDLHGRGCSRTESDGHWLPNGQTPIRAGAPCGAASPGLALLRDAAGAVPILQRLSPQDQQLARDRGACEPQPPAPPPPPPPPRALPCSTISSVAILYGAEIDGFCPGLCHRPLCFSILCQA